MTRFVFFLSAGVLIFASVMTLVMAVVIFLYWWHRDLLQPTMLETWPLLVSSTWLFAAITAVTAVSTVSLYLRHWSRWPATVLALVVTAFTILAFGELLGLSA